MSKDVLIRPHVTEKTTRLMEEAQYTFVVDTKATKPQIRHAVEARYPEVTIRKVRTLIMPAGQRRQFTRQGVVEGRTPAIKKAIVSLDPDGEQIDFFESI